MNTTNREPEHHDIATRPGWAVRLEPCDGHQDYWPPLYQITGPNAALAAGGATDAPTLADVTTAYLTETDPEAIADALDAVAVGTVPGDGITAEAWLLVFTREWMRRYGYHTAPPEAVASLVDIETEKIRIWAAEGLWSYQIIAQDPTGDWGPVSGTNTGFPGRAWALSVAAEELPYLATQPETTGTTHEPTRTRPRARH